MESATSLPRRRVGRPLSFDRDVALRQAMLLFWRHGYETTSIADLTAAMGISAPSLYAAFGDKRRLFLDAVRLYAGDPEDAARAIAQAPTARAAATALLRDAAAAFTGADTPPGCLVASAAATGSAAAAEVREALAAIRGGVEAALRARILRDVEEGRLPQGTDAAALAALTVAVVQGLSGAGPGRGWAGRSLSPSPPRRCAGGRGRPPDRALHPAGGGLASRS